MSLWFDLLKIFFPFGWGVLSLVGVFGYLITPDSPRWIAASAWFISMIISFGFVVHIWKYHRFQIQSNYNVLPEPNQKRVSIKLLIAVIICITTFIVSIVFWASKKPEEYADASAYTMSWIISAIWLWDLWTFHRSARPKVSFNTDDVTMEERKDATKTGDVGTSIHDQERAIEEETA